MAGFVENVSSPRTFSEGYPTHESNAAIVGAALGGFAKILDVGLKANAENRMEKLQAEVSNKLAGVIQPIAGQQVPAKQSEIGDDPSIFGSTPAWSKESGLRTITNLAQANRHSPDNVSTAEMLGKASSITQQLIQLHPRYATEIQSFVQKTLGFNPNEELLKTNIEDERTLRQQEFEQDSAAIRVGVASGIAPRYLANGQLDRASMLSDAAQIESMKRDQEKTLAQLQIREASDRVAIMENPKPSPEQVKATNEAMFRAPLDKGFNVLLSGALYHANLMLGRLNNPVMNAQLNSLSSTKDGHPMMPNIGDEKTIRYNMVMGMHKVRTDFDNIYNQYRANMDKAGITALDQSQLDAVKKSYTDQLDQIDKLINNAPKEVLEQYVTSLHLLQTDHQLQFQEANPVISAFLDAWHAYGDMSGTIQVALDNNPDARLALGKAATTSVANVADIANGKTTTIPDRGTAAAATNAVNQAGAAMAAGKTTGNTQVHTSWTNTMFTIISKGLEYGAQGLAGGSPVGLAGGGINPAASALAGQFIPKTPGEVIKQNGNLDQLAAAVQATSNGTQMQAFDELKKDPKMADKVEPLGEALVELNHNFVQATIPQLKPIVQGNRTYTPFYNPQSGRVEVEVKDRSGMIISRNMSYARGPEQFADTGRLIARVNQFNQSLNAITHLKEYSEQGNYQDLQLKQALANGIPMRPGARPIDMPEDKPKPEAKKETPKEPVKQTPAAYTTDDGFVVTGVAQ